MRTEESLCRSEVAEDSDPMVEESCIKKEKDEREEGKSVEVEIEIEVGLGVD